MRMEVRRRFFDITAPTVPGSPSATALNETTIRVAWQPSVDTGTGVQGYTVYRSLTPGGLYTPIGLTAPGTLFFDDVTLGGNTTRSYKVTAFDLTPNESAIASSPAVTATTPDLTAPNVPANVFATPISSTQITVSWSAATDSGGSGLAGYKIERSANGTTGWAQVGTSATTSFPDTSGLVASTTYFYRVRSYDNATNNSAYSTTASATTQSGGASSGAPLILQTDCSSGPTSGATDGAGVGCILTVYGINFGNISDWTSGANKLFIGGVEVANYRSCKPAVGQGLPLGNLGKGVYETWGIKALRVQVGSLGGAALNVALPITMTVGGVAPRNLVDGSGRLLDLDDRPFTFTPNNGTMTWVSLTGNDNNAGSFALAKRRLQAIGANFTGAVFGPSSVGGGNLTNQIQPGAHVYLMPGDYSGDTSFLGSWCDFFGRTGLLGREIVITSWPGAVGADANQDVVYRSGNGGAGGFNFASTADSARATPYGTIGMCHYICISLLRIFGPTGTFSTSGAAGCPINWQTQAAGSRITGCELSFNPSSGGPTSGGIGGHATDGVRQLNYVHHVGDPSSSLQNHGFYVGENAQSDEPTARGEIRSRNAYNVMHDIHGGQCIMVRGAYQTEVLPYCSFHHQWLQGSGKFSFETFDERAAVRCHNNIMIGETLTSPGTDGTQGGVAIGSDNVSVVNGLWIAFNTILGPWTHYAALYTFAGNGGGTLRFQGNVVRQRLTGTAPYAGTAFVIGSGITMVVDGNQWFDETGLDAAMPPEETAGAYGDQQFTNLAAFDLTPAPGSPLRNSGPTPAVVVQPFDFFFRPRPATGATKWARGAVEPVN